MAQRGRRLKRSTDRIVAGVYAGFAEYFDTDPAAIRILWAVLTVFTMLVPGIIAYVICWIAMPTRT